MNFKEALIAHLQGERVECRDGAGYSWRSFARYFGETNLANLERGTFDCFQFRLAPRTIRVNGVEVPAPESVAPKYGGSYYIADPSDRQLFCEGTAASHELDSIWLERGLVYLRKEYAIARAKAMLLTQSN